MDDMEQGSGPEFDVNGEGVRPDPLAAFSSEVMAKELLKRHPDMAEKKEEEEEKPETDPVRASADLVEARQGLLGEVKDKFPNLQPEDVAELKEFLGAARNAGEIKDEAARKAFIRIARGMSAERAEAAGGEIQTPAPLTASSREGGLTSDEIRQIKELAPRLNVPVDELKEQYVARKRMSA